MTPETTAPCQECQAKLILEMDVSALRRGLNN
jgi:hypothetical protein